MKKILLTCIAVACSLVAVAEELLIEAESFSQRGGWVLDQQFMDQMGSPYLMAHGMGIPVVDATAEINIPQAGTCICPYLQLDFTLDRCRGPRKVPPGFRRQIAESYIRTYR